VKKAGEAPKSALQFRDALGMAWYAPASLDALRQLLKSAPAATKKFVVGNTSIGVYKDQKPDMWIYIRDITELQVRLRMTHDTHTHTAHTTHTAANTQNCLAADRKRRRRQLA
jgi:hypothetical protein